jgi:DNA polymerase-1
MQRYNCFDVLATVRAWRGLERVLRANNQWDYYDQRVRPLLHPIMNVQRRGLRVDTDELTRLRHDLGEELADTERRIRAYSPDPYTLNLNASAQRAQLLYDQVGFKEPPPTNDRPARSTNQSALLWILQHLRKKDEPHRDLLEQLFHRSRLNTILTRYLTLQLDPDGRIRPRIKLTGAETGRLAYADPAIQQWPREIRTLLVPEPGYVFIAADYSQIEARILAILANDQASLDVFAAGGDVHAANARDLFELSEADWAAANPTVLEESRNFAKTFLYGISYGGEPETMKTKTFCPCPKCAEKVPATATLTKEAISRASQRWFAIHAPVLRWRDALGEEVRRTHQYTNPMGRKRYFCEPWPTFLRPLYNTPMQSTAADIINDATVRLDQQYAARIVLQHHDMLMLEVPEGKADHWSRVLRQEMERPVPELGNAVFPVDLKKGVSWGRMSKF